MQRALPFIRNTVQIFKEIGRHIEKHRRIHFWFVNNLAQFLIFFPGQKVLDEFYFSFSLSPSQSTQLLPPGEVRAQMLCDSPTCAKRFNYSLHDSISASSGLWFCNKGRYLSQDFRSFIKGDVAEIAPSLYEQGMRGF